jgi:hypothetical protein
MLKEYCDSSDGSDPKCLPCYPKPGFVDPCPPIQREYCGDTSEAFDKGKIDPKCLPCYAKVDACYPLKRQYCGDNSNGIPKDKIDPECLPCYPTNGHHRKDPCPPQQKAYCDNSFGTDAKCLPCYPKGRHIPFGN